MRCHYVRGLDGYRVLIPGCWARAINERADCICSREKTTIECLEERIEKLETQVREYQQITKTEG